MSSLTTSATRRSRSVPAAVLIASAAASSHEVLLVPMISVTLYTLITLSFDHVRPPLGCCAQPATKGPGSGAAAVRASDDLQDVAAGVLPVHAPAAVVGVELVRPALAGVGPVRQPTVPDPAEDLVEIGFRNEERVVLRTDRTVVIGEVQGDAVAGVYGQERPERLGVVQAKDLGQELCRFALVTDPDDGVIQFGTH